LINEGGLVFDGPTVDGINRYYQIFQAPTGSATATDQGADDASGLELLGFDLVDDRGRDTAYIQSGDEGVFRIAVRANGDIERPFANVTIATDKGVLVYSDTNGDSPFPPLRDGEKAVMTFRVPLNLVAGGYVAAGSLHGGTLTDNEILARFEPVSFFVASSRMAGGVADLGGKFGVQAGD